MRLKEALKDDIRIEYYHKHLLALLSAMRSEHQFRHSAISKQLKMLLGNSALFHMPSQGWSKREGVLRMVSA